MIEQQFDYSTSLTSNVHTNAIRRKQKITEQYPQLGNDLFFSTSDFFLCGTLFHPRSCKEEMTSR